MISSTFRSRSWLLVLLLAGVGASAQPVVGFREVANASAPQGQAGALPNFNLTPQAMRQTTADSTLSLNSTLASIAAIKAEDRTFENTIRAVDTAYDVFQTAVTPVTFLAQVSADEETRKTAEELDKTTHQLFIELAAREDLYRAVKQYADKGESLAGDQKKMVDGMLRDFKRNGMELPADQRARLNEIQKRISVLQSDFENNLNDGHDKLEVVRDQLEGLPEDYVKNLPASPNRGDSVLISLDYPTYEKFMNGVKNPALRQQLEYKFNNQAAEKNVPILEQILRLRQEMAGLLGYPTYAHYATANAMAKTPNAVMDFLNRLKNMLVGKVAEEKAAMLALKKQDLPTADSLYNWDLPGEIGGQLGYYLEALKKKQSDVDPEEVRQYFPVDRVVEQTLGVYQELLQVEFRERPVAAPVPGASSANVWHPDVRLFEVLDPKTHELIAHFYLDLYPREGKYGHMAEFRLIGGRQLPDGSYQKPVAAMVGNFTKPSAGKPALLSHSEVETFFHEFGHVMHETLTKARYAGQSGTNTARDFVEAPSQMLENFVWNKEILNRLSGHYQDPSRKLPPELLEKMLASSRVGSAIGTLRLIALSVLDMVYHSGVPGDTTSLMAQVFADVGYLAPTPGTYFQARFGHIVDGYEAGYYGYLWSKVFAQDIYTRFEKEGVLNPKVGGDYRRAILEKGGSEDEDQMLLDFLGRAPNDEAFLRSLGLDPKP